MALDKIDIAALRKADRILFRHSGGKSTIEAIKDGVKTERDPFARDVDHIIPCDFRIEDYTEGLFRISHDARRAGRFEAFESVHRYAHTTGVFDTFAAFLRPGDEIRLEWMRDAGRTLALAETPLHADELRAHVSRGETGRYMFHIDYRITDDSGARMVRVPWSSTRQAEALAVDAAAA